VSNCSKTVALFDHLVGAGEQRRWNFEAERLRGKYNANVLDLYNRVSWGAPVVVTR